jgi:hypothetical protein
MPWLINSFLILRVSEWFPDGVSFCSKDSRMLSLMGPSLVRYLWSELELVLGEPNNETVADRAAYAMISVSGP